MCAKKSILKSVDIIILSFNTKERTLRCLKWLKIHTRYQSHQVIVIDNASTDGSREALRTMSWIKLIENPINVGVSKGWNQGIKPVMDGRSLKDRYIMLLNSDTLVALDWLETLVGVMETDNRIGVVSYGDMTNPPQGALVDVNNISFVCSLIRGEVFEDVGLFDERLFAWHSDSIFCERALAAGWRIVTTPENLIYHFGSSSVTELLKYLMDKDAETANRIHEEEINAGR